MLPLAAVLLAARLTPPEIAATVTVSPPYSVRTFQQRLDHFGNGPNSARLWPQRFLINDTFWGGPGHPILFYTGNEGPIEAFYAACGFMTTVLAPKFKALLIFAEQRYYGKSLPFGHTSWSAGALTYLSTEQVLADYANMLTTLKGTLNTTSSKVVAFGGSYGGTLATLFRVKYPHVVVGSLAASAPLGYYSPSHWTERGVDEFTWFRTVERVYTESRNGCYSALVRAVGLANATARSTEPTRRNMVTAAFGLCSPPLQVNEFIFWITEALESMPQIDYPYAIGALPPSPVNATCAAVRAELSDLALLTALGRLIQTFYGTGGTRSESCTPEELARNSQVGGGIPGDGPAPAESWGYQSCTETLHAFSVPNGSWRPYSFSLLGVSALCQRYYNVTPRTRWLETWSGGYAIGGGASSNIIWSNGRRDPWHGGGFLKASDALPGGAVFVMDTTAHHQDLRLPHPSDPLELVKVREQEQAIMRDWLGLGKQ